MFDTFLIDFETKTACNNPDRRFSFDMVDAVYWFGFGFEFVFMFVFRVGFGFGFRYTLVLRVETAL